MENTACISAKGLIKKYSKFTLGELDFEIPKGFSTALIGANGAGKTTLIDTLCGVTRSNGGEVTYFGIETDLDSPALRERIGYCSANNFFPMNFTAKDIASSMEIAYKGFNRAKFGELCKKFDIDSEHSKKPRAMFKQSDGNRMRTCLASVFSRETELLILDEPGSSLDPLMRDRLCDYMREYLDDNNGNKSILFSTHNIADMENIADYVIFMEKGKIIEQGFSIPTVLLRMYNLRTPQNAGKFFFSMPRVEYWFRHMIIATNGLCAVSGAILGTASAVLCNDINVGIICFSAILFQAGILNLLGYANMRILISRI